VEVFASTTKKPAKQITVQGLSANKEPLNGHGERLCREQRTTQSRWLTRQITRRMARQFSHTRRQLSWWLTHLILVRLRVCFHTLHDGFRGSLFVRLLIGLLVGLHSSFLTLVDGFRCGSLIGLLVRLLVGLRVTLFSPVVGFCYNSRVGVLVGLHVSLLTLANAFSGGSLVGLLVGLYVYFHTLVDDLRCDFRGSLLVGLLVGLPITFFKIVNGFRGGSLVGLLVRLLIGLLVTLFALLPSTISKSESHRWPSLWRAISVYVRNETSNLMLCMSLVYLTISPECELETLSFVPDALLFPLLFLGALYILR